MHNKLLPQQHYQYNRQWTYFAFKMNTQNQCGHKSSARRVLQGPVTGRWMPHERQLLPQSTRDYFGERKGSLFKILLRVYILLFKFLCRGLSPRDPRLRHHKYRGYFPPEVLQIVLGKANKSEQEGLLNEAATKEHTVTVIDHSTEMPHSRPKKSILKKNKENKCSDDTSQSIGQKYQLSTKLKRRLRHSTEGEVVQSCEPRANVASDRPECKSFSNSFKEVPKPYKLRAQASKCSQINVHSDKGRPVTNQGTM